MFQGLIRTYKMMCISEASFVASEALLCILGGARQL